MTNKTYIWGWPCMGLVDTIYSSIIIWMYQNQIYFMHSADDLWPRFKTLRRSKWETVRWILRTQASVWMNPDTTRALRWSSRIPYDDIWGDVDTVKPLQKYIELHKFIELSGNFDSHTVGVLLRNVLRYILLENIRICLHFLFYVHIKTATAFEIYHPDKTQLCNKVNIMYCDDKVIQDLRVSARVVMNLTAVFWITMASAHIVLRVMWVKSKTIWSLLKKIELQNFVYNVMFKRDSRWMAGVFSIVTNTLGLIWVFGRSI